MWAHVWDRTVHHCPTGDVVLPLHPYVQPRIEPEVAFYVASDVPVTDDPEAILASVRSVAPAFEIVQCPFPEWKFTLADSTAAFGVHGALLVGPAVEVGQRDRSRLADTLASFTVTLARDGVEVDRGVGSNVLGSPALALAHLARLLAGQREFEALSGGEVVTTGTVTDAWPVSPGETWTADFGALDLAHMRVTFA